MTKIPENTIKRINFIANAQKSIKSLKFGDRQNSIDQLISTGVEHNENIQNASDADEVNLINLIADDDSSEINNDPDSNENESEVVNDANDESNEDENESDANDDSNEDKNESPPAAISVENSSDELVQPNQSN